MNNSITYYNNLILLVSNTEHIIWIITKLKQTVVHATFYLLDS